MKKIWMLIVLVIIAIACTDCGQEKVTAHKWQLSDEGTENVLTWDEV